MKTKLFSKLQLRKLSHKEPDQAVDPLLTAEQTPTVYTQDLPELTDKLTQLAQDNVINVHNAEIVIATMFALMCKGASEHAVLENSVALAQTHKDVSAVGALAEISMIEDVLRSTGLDEAAIAAIIPEKEPLATA